MSFSFHLSMPRSLSNEPERLAKVAGAKAEGRAIRAEHQPLQNEDAYRRKMDALVAAARRQAQADRETARASAEEVAAGEEVRRALDELRQEKGESFWYLVSTSHVCQILNSYFLSMLFRNETRRGRPHAKRSADAGDAREGPLPQHRERPLPQHEGRIPNLRGGGYAAHAGGTDRGGEG